MGFSSIRLCLSSKRTHWSTEGFRNELVLRHSWITGRGVGRKAFDEESHEDYEPHPHQQHSVPVGRDPLCYREEGLLVEEKVLESHQWTLSVNLSTFVENVAISLEIVARGTRPQCHSFRQTWYDPSPSPVGCCFAGSVGATVDAGQVTEVTFTVVLCRGEETLIHPVFETYAALALPRLADLGPLVALCLVVDLVARFGTRCHVAVAEGCRGTFIVILALDALPPRHKLTTVFAALALAW